VRVVFASMLAFVFLKQLCAVTTPERELTPRTARTCPAKSGRRYGGQHLRNTSHRPRSAEVSRKRKLKALQHVKRASVSVERTKKPRVPSSPSPPVSPHARSPVLLSDDKDKAERINDDSIVEPLRQVPPSPQQGPGPQALMSRGTKPLPAVTVAFARNNTGDGLAFSTAPRSRLEQPTPAQATIPATPGPVALQLKHLSDVIRSTPHSKQTMVHSQPTPAPAPAVAGTAVTVAPGINAEVKTACRALSAALEGFHSLRDSSILKAIHGASEKLISTHTHHLEEEQRAEIKQQDTLSQKLSQDAQALCSSLRSRTVDTGNEELEALDATVSKHAEQLYALTSCDAADVLEGRFDGWNDKAQSLYAKHRDHVRRRLKSKRSAESLGGAEVIATLRRMSSIRLDDEEESGSE